MYRNRWILVLGLVCLFVSVADAQQREAAVVQTAESAIADATARIAQARSVGAETYATAIFEEAEWRLNFAKETLATGRPEAKNDAMLRAIQARHAAEAAEARARWLGTVAEVESLREEIKGFGQTPGGDPLYKESDDKINRGETSRDRVAYAEKAVERASGLDIGADERKQLSKASELLGSARKVAGTTKLSTSADHLAYVAEMTARKIEYQNRLAKVAALVPDLRVRRSELARAAMEAKEAEERRRREEEERRLREVRTRFDDQVGILKTRLETDRTKRIEAERRLDLVRAEYETALARAKTIAETEKARRIVEDQTLLTGQMIDRETESEKSISDALQIARSQLESDRAAGQVSDSELAVRKEQIAALETYLRGRRESRMETAMERERAREAYDRRVAASEKRLRETEEEAAMLAKKMEEERRRTAEAEAELKRLQDEMARREQEEKERMDQMKKALAELADTRSDERGFIVNLGGVLFATGKAELQAGAKTNLARIAGHLRGNEKLMLTVEGHTDNVGSDASNLELSRRRAQAVVDFLVAEGVAKQRIQAVGKGESEPIASNDDAAGRQQNRRVEIVIAEVQADRE